MTQILKLTWEDVEKLSNDSLPVLSGNQKVYGIPRGGAIVARLFYPIERIAENPEDADFFIDDIFDSGKTATDYQTRYGKPTYTLLSKLSLANQHFDQFLKDRGIQTPVQDGIWVQFPWEEDAKKDLEDTVVRQLQFVGEDATREGLHDTPRRVIKALGELTCGYKMDPKKILTSAMFTDKFDEMVVVKKIPFWSLCEHHMLPFHGTASVAYIPHGKIVGLSKIPRIVEAFSRRLQVQERLTQEIAHCIEEALGCPDVAVHIEGYHTCMAMRGVKSSGNMVTNCLLGSFKNNPATRAEFLGEIR